LAFDYHFLYIDPALGAEWLFNAAPQYWARFRPIVINSLDLVAFASRRSQVALTILARRDFAPDVIAEAKKRFPRAYHDPLVYDVARDLALTLNGRAKLEQPFGLPATPSGE
jgi:hypothetical protein